MANHQVTNKDMKPLSVLASVLKNDSGVSGSSVKDALEWILDNMVEDLPPSGSVVITPPAGMATVTFSPEPDTNYRIALAASSEGDAWFENKGVGGFEIHVPSLFDGIVDWGIFRTSDPSEKGGSASITSPDGYVQVTFSDVFSDNDYNIISLTGSATGDLWWGDKQPDGFKIYSPSLWSGDIDWFVRHN